MPEITKHSDLTHFYLEYLRQVIPGILPKLTKPSERLSPRVRRLADVII